MYYNVILSVISYNFKMGNGTTDAVKRARSKYEVSGTV